MSGASHSSRSAAHAPSEPSASSEAHEPDDFPFHILGLCLALAWGTAKYLDMPTRQVFFEYALPIFLITQIVNQGIHWLRKSNRWSRGLESDAACGQLRLRTLRAERRVSDQAS